jgi:anthranilate synthase/aminodeoxychorismate synthase-like glutamine amidotransferase
MKTVALIDNYDSFTFNLYQQIQTTPTAEPINTLVFRNDAISIPELFALQPAAIVISPGPGRPSDAGISLAVIERALEWRIPLLGVCLGHQALAHVLGASVIAAPVPLHGYTSRIEHSQQGLFTGISTPCTVMRYHSLVVDTQTIPAGISVDATCPDDSTIMALRVDSAPAWGVQFHPESFLTSNGHLLIKNF